MHVEIQVALNFLISFLYNKLPRRRVNQFGEELENALKIKFDGHWYPEKPFKGSAFRCLKTTPPLDPVFDVAARESGMDLIDIQENLPQELSIWIDPGEVSYRMSEKGPVKILYSESDRAIDTENSDREVIRTFNPEAQCFKPIEATAAQFGSLSLSSNPCSPLAGMNGLSSAAPSYNGSVAPAAIYKPCTPTVNGFLPKSSSNNVTFTTATFAQTKFGSTKLKFNSKRSHRMSPTEFSNYIKQREMIQQQQAALAAAAQVNGVQHCANVPSNGMASPVHGGANGASTNGLFTATTGNSVVGNVSPTHNSRSISPINGYNDSLMFTSDRSMLMTTNNSAPAQLSNTLYNGQTIYPTVTSSSGRSLTSSFSANGMIGSGHHSSSGHYAPQQHHSSQLSGLDNGHLADLLGSELVKSSQPLNTPQLSNNVFRFSSLFDNKQSSPFSNGLTSGNGFSFTSPILSGSASPSSSLSSSPPSSSYSHSPTGTYCPSTAQANVASGSNGTSINNSGSMSGAIGNPLLVQSSIQSSQSFSSSLSSSSVSSTGGNGSPTSNSNSNSSDSMDSGINVDATASLSANDLPNSALSLGSSPPSASKGYDNLSFTLNGVSYPNQYQHLLVAN